jgi:hypothetical protein
VPSPFWSTLLTNVAVLTWVSIYWFSRGGPTASTRLYYEFVKAREADGGFFKNLNTSVPTGFSYFPKEVFTPPRRFVLRLLCAEIFSDFVTAGGLHGPRPTSFSNPTMIKEVILQPTKFPRVLLAIFGRCSPRKALASASCQARPATQNSRQPINWLERILYQTSYNSFRSSTTRVNLLVNCDPYTTGIRGPLS